MIWMTAKKPIHFFFAPVASAIEPRMGEKIAMMKLAIVAALLQCVCAEMGSSVSRETN